MLATDQRSEGFGLLSQRLHERFGQDDVGNGTALSAALISALQVDLRISGAVDGLERLAALTDEELDGLKLDLFCTIESSFRHFKLPLGTRFSSNVNGDYSIGGEQWLLDAGRPGLHPMELMRRDAHGPNLDLLLSHIGRLTRRLQCRALGLPSPARVYEGGVRHLLQFPPCADAGGVVLQRQANGTDAPRFCAAMPEEVRDFAEAIVDDMQALWKRRAAIGARAKEVRSLADEAAAKHDTRVQLVAIDMTQQADDGGFDMYVQYHGVDQAMRPGPVLDLVPGRNHGVADRLRAPAGVADRPAELARLRHLGADGRIDDMAAAIAVAAPGGASAVFAQLAQDYETVVELPPSGGRTFATLYWHEGTIRVEVTKAGALDWAGTRLELASEPLPATVVSALIGQHVDSFAELPFGCPCIVENATTTEKGLRLDLRVGDKLINLSTGGIWGEPNGRQQQP